jgi:hypothetical protein
MTCCLASQDICENALRTGLVMGRFLGMLAVIPQEGIMATTKKAAAPAAETAKKSPATRRVKSFAPKKFEEHTLVDADNRIVGHIRVKPSGILWSPKNGKDWYGLGLEEFAEIIERDGKKQKK